MGPGPVWTFLGRRGRAEVVAALRTRATWSIAALAHAAQVHPVVAGRAVRELEALAAVDVFRPGRDAVVRFRPESRAGRFLASLDPPDLHAEAARAFAAAFQAPGTRVVRWRMPQDDPLDPLVPLRLALVHRGDPDAALEASGPALDAVRAQGLPAPDLMPVARAGLGDDEVARAIRAGTVVGPASEGR